MESINKMGRKLMFDYHAIAALTTRLFLISMHFMDAFRFFFFAFHTQTDLQ